MIRFLIHFSENLKKVWISPEFSGGRADIKAEDEKRGGDSMDQDFIGVCVE